MTSPVFHHFFFVLFAFLWMPGKQKMCVWLCVCVCMRYWMDSIYNWMLSSLTIILPSMTTFFKLVCCIKRLLLVSVYFISQCFLSCFYHSVSCYLCNFSGYTSFLSLLSISFIPCLWFLFCCCCVCVCKSFPFFRPTSLYKIHIYIYREYLPLRTKS